MSRTSVLSLLNPQAKEVLGIYSNEMKADTIKANLKIRLELLSFVLTPEEFDKVASLFTYVNMTISGNMDFLSEEDRKVNDWYVSDYVNKRSEKILNLINKHARKQLEDNDWTCSVTTSYWKLYLLKDKLYKCKFLLSELFPELRDLIDAIIGFQNNQIEELIGIKVKCDSTVTFSITISYKDLETLEIVLPF